jgi:hypothetical protein
MASLAGDERLFKVAKGARAIGMRFGRQKASASCLRPVKLIGLQWYSSMTTFVFICLHLWSRMYSAQPPS